MTAQLCRAAAVLLLWSAAGTQAVDVSQFQFLNKGVVEKGQWWPQVEYASLYAEPENVTRTDYAWADVHTTTELYSQSILNHRGKAGERYANTDLPGADFEQLPDVELEQCAATCLATPMCQAWVYGAAPAEFGKCAKSQRCCYLKSGVPSRRSHRGLTAGTVEQPQLGADVQPVTGVRTAPPLGGVAAGTVELRADGSFTAWTFENNSPAGSGKVPKQHRTFLAARVSTQAGVWAKVLQTSPVDGLPAVDGLAFSGSPPVTRLVAQGTPASVSVSVVAFSSLASGDMRWSHTPAISFSFEFVNKGTHAVDVAGLLHLQGFFDNVQRTSKHVYRKASADTADACAAACNSDSRCATFEYSTEDAACTLQSDSPLYAFRDGTSSGTRSVWSSTHSTCVTVDKPGSGPMHGNYSLCGDGGSVTVASGKAAALWEVFNKQGNLSGVGVDPKAPHGAAAVSTTVPAGATKVVTVVLGYYFPHRQYLTTPIGNQYTHFYDSSEAAALSMVSRLDQVVDKVRAVQDPILGSTLPEWMRDTLVGTLHHTRSAWWDAEGRWRQWEAYDCVNVDSVHNDGERHIPYIMLFPDSVKNKMVRWGTEQQSNGMIPEQLACGCQGAIDPALDKGCGRVMSDVSSMYIVYLAELLRWHNDTEFVRTWYQTAKRAADWHISVSTYHSMPYKLQTTYDVLAFNRYEAASYSTVFHLLAMRAMQDLASFFGDDGSRYKAAEDAARASLEAMMWDEGLGAYIAYTGGKAVFADTFYPQVLAYSLGYGPLVNVSRMRTHLDTEAKTNADPLGLKILTGRTSGNTITEGDIWMMAPADHSTLRLRLGGESVDSALEVASRPYKWLTQGSNDLWKAAGVLLGTPNTFSGMCSLTSHYGYYMTVWHTMLAMSGQTADLASARKVSFTPVPKPPFKLPVMLPGVVGYINATSATSASLCLTSGSLQDVTVTWWSLSTGGKVTVQAGGCVSSQ